MEQNREIRLLAAERLDEGLVLRFADGRCGYYSAALLSELFPLAEEKNENKVDW